MNETSQEINDPAPTGPVVGIILIVLLVLLGGWYFWSIARNGSDKTTRGQAPATTEQNP